jgi:hypothetical protein
VPITHQQDGLPSNRRREIAKSVPAKISSEPSAPIGISANSAAACSAADREHERRGPENDWR